jgi:hypothetical protein
LHVQENNQKTHPLTMLMTTKLLLIFYLLHKSIDLQQSEEDDREKDKTHNKQMNEINK